MCSCLDLHFKKIVSEFALNGCYHPETFEIILGPIKKEFFIAFINFMRLILPIVHEFHVLIEANHHYIYQTSRPLQYSNI